MPDKTPERNKYAWANLERPLHTSFWVGVAAGLLVAVLIVVGIVGEHIDPDPSYAVVPLVAAFVALCAMTIMYVILLLCNVALRLIERQDSTRKPTSRCSR
ncbi:hypothetical protein [Nocardioides sp. NPDC006273]|uniref:hypothetical protein n=1 Tax=Nocardioides sp. NPDC006273 TaxID=3155598 RepID=UPI0033B8DF98